MFAPMRTVNGHYLAMIDDQYPPKILSVAKIPENVYNEQVKQAVEELNRMITSYLVQCAPIAVMNARVSDLTSLEGDNTPNWSS